MNSSPPADLAARMRAASDFSCNLVVQAGAGSGKTSLLVERALQALARGIVSPAQMVAITFTEKAAAEMLLRLAAALDDLRNLAEGRGDEVDPNSPAARTYPDLVSRHGLEPATIRQRAVRALQQLHRLPVKTLHTFCADILRAHPGAAGVDPSFTVDSGEKWRLLFDQEWTRFLAVELGPEGTRRKLWDRILSRLTATQLATLAGQLAGFKIPLDALDTSQEAESARSLLRPRVQRLIEGVHGLLEQSESLTPKQGPVIQGLLAALQALDRDGFTACRQVLVDNPVLAGKLNSSSGLKPSTKSDSIFASLFNITVKASLRILRGVARSDAELSSDVTTALAPFASSFRQSYLRSGQVSFDGLLTLTRDLLLHDIQVREAVRQRYRLLLVDEFQDTDPVQYDIVLLLAEEDGGCATDPYEAKLAPGRLFIVGDPKQSIYRFRGADYASFKRAVERVKEDGGQGLDLTANFRSTESILTPINTLFTGEDAWTPSDYQPAYMPIHAYVNKAAEEKAGEEPATAAPAVEIWTVASDQSSAGGRRHQEADALSREIHRLAGDEPGGHSRITILFRSFSNIDIYLRSLRRAGIPFVVDGGSKDFDQRREVEDLVALLRALARPGDPLALLAFLRSPSGGVPDTELSTHGGRNGDWNWSTGELPDAVSLPCLRRAVARLRELAEATRLLPADSIIDHVLKHSPLVSLSAAAHEGAQRVANLRRLAGLATAMARDGSLDLNDVAEALQDAGRNDLDGDSPLADEQEDAVRILTIHKAKGLENDVIILPDLARTDRNSGTRSVEAQAPFLPIGGRQLVMDLDRYCSPAWVWHQAEEKDHELAEEMRVLYVALTRARRQLLVINAGGRGGAWLKALARWDYSSEALPGDEELLAGGRILHRSISLSGDEHKAPASSLPDLESAISGWQQATDRLRATGGVLLRHPSGIHEERVQRADTEMNAAARGEAQAIGTLLHRALERAVSGTGVDLLGELRKAVRPVAGEYKVDPGNLGRKGEDLLESFIGTQLHERLLSCKVLGREIPLLVQDGNGVTWQGSLDLLLEEDGLIKIIDFKTDRETDPEALILAHGDQLAVYTAAVMGALQLPEPPAAELWLLRSGEALAIPVAERLQRLKLAPSGS